MTGNALDEIRTRTAARYLEGQIWRARMDAIKRSRAVGLRFEPWNGDYVFGVSVDGNGNGIRTTDIGQSLDPELATPDRLSDKFPGVSAPLASEVLPIVHLRP